jgi:putative flippase GtrA
MIEVGLATIPSVIIGIVASYIASKIFLYTNNYLRLYSLN